MFELCKFDKKMEPLPGSVYCGFATFVLADYQPATNGGISHY